MRRKTVLLCLSAAALWSSSVWVLNSGLQGWHDSDQTHENGISPCSKSETVREESLTSKHRRFHDQSNSQGNLMISLLRLFSDLTGSQIFPWNLLCFSVTDSNAPIRILCKGCLRFLCILILSEHSQSPVCLLSGRRPTNTYQAFVGTVGDKAGAGWLRRLSVSLGAIAGPRLSTNTPPESSRFTAAVLRTFWFCRYRAEEIKCLLRSRLISS